MAYVDTNTQDIQNQQAIATAQPAPTTATGGAPAVSKSPTSNVSNQVVGTNTPAQPFQNVGAYLTANAPQAVQEGQTIAGGLNSQSANINSGITNAANTFTGDVNAATKNFTPTQATSLETSPTAFASNPSDVATFESLYNNVSPYSGPTDFTTSSAYQPLNTAATGGANLAGTLNNYNGVQSYLQGLNPNATAGTAALDTTLLEGTPAGLQPIQGAAANLSTLPGTLASTTAAENSLAAQGAATTGNAATTAGTAATAAEKNIQDQINAEVAAAQGKLGTTEGQLTSDFAAGTVTPQELISLGMSPTDAAAATKNLSALSKDYSAPPLSNFYAAQTPSVVDTAANTATPQDYATVQALEGLLGPSYNAPLNPANTPQAGTAITAPTGLDTTGLSKYLSDTLGQKDTALLQNPFQGIQGLTPQQIMANPALVKQLKEVKDAATRAGKTEVNGIPLSQFPV